MKHYAVLYEGTIAETEELLATEGDGFLAAQDDLSVATATDTVTVHRIPFVKGQTVAQAIYLSGFFASPPLCSGMGRCGHCRVGLWRCLDGVYQPVTLTLQEQEYFQSVEGLDFPKAGMLMQSSDFLHGGEFLNDVLLTHGVNLASEEALSEGRELWPGDNLVGNGEKDGGGGLASHPGYDEHGKGAKNAKQIKGAGRISGSLTIGSQIFARMALFAEALPMGGAAPMVTNMPVDTASDSDVCPTLIPFLQAGWHLGCQHTACAGDIVLLPENVALSHEGRFVNEGYFSLDHTAAAATGQGADWLAVDMGTTSVHWAVSADKKMEGSFSNPQMGAGSDVVSRIQASLSEGGRKRLAGLAQRVLRSLVQQIGGAQTIIFAANPAMASIFLDNDVTSLAHAPYALPDAGGDWVQVNNLPPLWVCPHISPFVGGDISAGYASLIQQQAEFPFLLADMGTNGEFILALSPEKAFATSVALGPALEGINLSFGSEAKEGVVVDFMLTPLELKPIWFSSVKDVSREGAGAPVAPSFGLVTNEFLGGQVAPLPSEGIKMSGTAYISLLSQLIDGRAMTRQGQFVEGGGSFARLLQNAVKQTLQGGLSSTASCLSSIHHSNSSHLPSSLGPSFPLSLGLKLYASDVEEIIKVKAAFSLGLKRLLAHAGVSFHELRHVYLAGALGHNVDTMALENLGFFPPGAHGRIVPVGNAALAGAMELAHHEELRDWLVAWTKTVISVNLAEDATFAEEFLKHMSFDW